MHWLMEKRSGARRVQLQVDILVHGTLLFWEPPLWERPEYLRING